MHFPPSLRMLTDTSDQRAIDTLLRLAETYQGHTKSVTGDGAGAVKGAHSGNDGLNAAEADLRVCYI